MENIIDNFNESIYQTHPKGVDLLRIDLEEIIRQQADHILDLEFKLQEMTGKWEYLEKEMMDMELQKELENNID